jgi:HEPN domain-containing protein
MERNLLKERAMRFLKEAEDDIGKGFFDFSVFHSEQAIQLRLKSFLLEKIGYFSRTHSLITLVEEVSKVSPELGSFLLRSKEKLEELQLAYTGSRCLPIVYSRQKAAELLEFVKSAFEEVEKLERTG